jgi:hypothetical protein
MSEPTWTDIVTAFSTLGLGVIGLYFARKQYEITKLQWKHELYDRRMAIYVVAGRTISYLVTHGKITDEVLFDFSQKARESDFLLNAAITAKLDEIYNKAIDLQVFQAELQDLPVGEERTAIARKIGEIKTWFFAQGSELKVLFSPFLELGQ